MAVVKLNRAIQYRAYPTEAQAVLLAKTFGCVRFAWNRMLMDAVFVEDINLRGLAGSLKLGKSTNDNGFGMFRTMLEYKLTSQGKTFAKIDKWYPSSKTCSVCGLVKDDLTLADRSWTCSSCGTTRNRDHNAAINIRNLGLLGLYPA